MSSRFERVGKLYGTMNFHDEKQDYPSEVISQLGCISDQLTEGLENVQLIYLPFFDLYNHFTDIVNIL